MSIGSHRRPFMIGGGSSSISRHMHEAQAKTGITKHSARRLLQLEAHVLSMLRLYSGAAQSDSTLELSGVSMSPLHKSGLRLNARSAQSRLKVFSSTLSQTWTWNDIVQSSHYSNSPLLSRLFGSHFHLLSTAQPLRICRRS
jgi:hypothetical protein